MKTHEILGCELCRFRMKSRDGCYKFGITFDEMDGREDRKGYQVHYAEETVRKARKAGTILQNDVPLDRNNICPWSPKRGVLRYGKG